MRLYNKTPREIWDDTPLAYRVVLIAGALFISFAFIFLIIQAVNSISRSLGAGKGPVDVHAARAVSFLDPSMASDGKSMSALAYTGLETPSNPNANALKISLATADFPCKLWR